MLVPVPQRRLDRPLGLTKHLRLAQAVYAKGFGAPGVVGASGNLYQPAALEPLAVAGPDIAQILSALVPCPAGYLLDIPQAAALMPYLREIGRDAEGVVDMVRGHFREHPLY